MSSPSVSKWVSYSLKDLMTEPVKDKIIDPENHELLTVKLYGHGVVRTGKKPKPTEQSRPYYRRLKGEILIGRQNFHNGGVGLVSADTSGLIASNAISSYMPTEIADTHFLLYSFLQPRFLQEVENNASGTGQKEISPNQIANLSLEIPPLKEQQKIAEILTSVDEVIENTQSQISKLDDLKKATMNELLTRGIGHAEFKDTDIGKTPKDWQLKSLREVCFFQRGHDLISEKRTHGIFPVVSSSGITGYHSEKTTIGPGVVIGRKGNIGSVHYIESDFWAHDTSLYVADFCGNLPKFVFYLCEWLKLDKYGTKSGSPSLNRNDIHSLKIAVPPLSEQRGIQSCLDNTSNLLHANCVKVSRLNLLKKSLMQDLLTGKVRVTVN